MIACNAHAVQNGSDISQNVWQVYLSGHSGVVWANDNCCGCYGCPLWLYIDAGGRNIETFRLDVTPCAQHIGF